MLIVESSDINR